MFDHVGVLGSDHSKKSTNVLFDLYVKTGNQSLPSLLLRLQCIRNTINWWHNGQSTHPPSMWPGFDSQTWRHTWVEFVQVLLSALRGFPQELWFFPLLKILHLIRFDLC